MPLFFLPLLAVATASDVECSWTTVNLGTQTCHNSQRIEKTFDDLDTCMGDCEADGDCMGIFWQSPEQRGKTEPKCHRYRACDAMRTPPHAGTNYRLICETAPIVSTQEVLQIGLDTTGCTSGIITSDAPTDTSYWETLTGDTLQKNTQQLFADMYDTCYNTMRGTATSAQETQCCGEVAISTHEESVERHELYGGAIIETCGPKASMIPLTLTSVSSNPPDCKQLYNYPCEAFTFRERVSRALLATGCPNRNPDLDLIDSWEGRSDAQVWGYLQDYCEVVQKSLGTESTQQRGRDFCCENGEDCMPTHCTTQTSWDCGEPKCPIMEDTKITSALGIETYMENNVNDCQTLCQLHYLCHSWTYDETSTMCWLYKDTVSTSSTEAHTGRHSGYKCGRTYNCREGQGKSGGKYAMYEYNTEAECAAKCSEDAGQKEMGTSVKRTYTCVRGQGPGGMGTSHNGLNNRDICANKCNTIDGCVGFDWTTYDRSDSCRTYTTTNGERVDNAGSHERDWCTVVATRAGDWCVRLETGTASNNDGTLDVYINGAKVATGSHSKGADVWDECYSSEPKVEVQNPTNNAWAGTVQMSSDAGATWYNVDCASCSTSSSAPSGKFVADGNTDGSDQGQTGCLGGNRCQLSLPTACVGFDFTTEDDMSNSCRLYSSTDSPRLGDDGGDDERMWCEEHTGGFLPEADFDCQSGSLPFASGYFQSEESPEECARRCSRDLACAGFDFSAEPAANNKCRLMYYERDELVNTGTAGGMNRRWCRRVTFSERQNQFCDGIPEDLCVDEPFCRWINDACTIEDTIWCRNGRISDDKSKWTKNYADYDVSDSRECWEKCEESPHCFAYEYKTDGTCLLHDAFQVLDTYSRYVYQQGCEEGDDSFGCSDQIPEDKNWKYCRRIATSDIDWLYQQEWWAPSYP